MGANIQPNPPQSGVTGAQPVASQVALTAQDRIVLDGIRPNFETLIRLLQHEQGILPADVKKGDEWADVDAKTQTGIVAGEFVDAYSGLSDPGKQVIGNVTAGNIRLADVIGQGKDSPKLTGWVTDFALAQATDPQAGDFWA